MHHLEIFGKLCLLEGIDPRWWSCEEGCFEYWNASYHEYPKELGYLLRYAIQSENEAIEKYQYQASRIDDPCIVEMLDRIILDELHHVRLLTNLLCKYCG